MLQINAKAYTFDVQVFNIIDKSRNKTYIFEKIFIKLPVNKNTKRIVCKVCKKPGYLDENFYLKKGKKN